MLLQVSMPSTEFQRITKDLGSIGDTGGCGGGGMGCSCVARHARTAYHTAPMAAPPPSRLQWRSA